MQYGNNTNTNTTTTTTNNNNTNNTNNNHDNNNSNAVSWRFPGPPVYNTRYRFANSLYY